MSVLLLTGATGSFGRAFVGRALRERWYERIIAFSDTESNQSAMKADFPPSDALEYFIGNVRDYDRVRQAMDAGVDYVVHAAAMKEVPTCEYDWPEAVATNVDGSKNVAQAAIASGVARAILISTDKAVDAITEYGKTKAMAESWFIRSNRGYSPHGLHLRNVTEAQGLRRKGHGTQLSVIRYGNVIASRASIVPTARAKIEAGVAVPVTDIGMTRFWWTLDNAVEFVQRALQTGGAGHIWVPKIPAAPVLMLLQAISGGVTNVEAIGIRGKEKMHERLLSADEVRNAYELPNAYVVVDPGASWPTAPPPGAVRVDPAFDYSSGNEALWVGVDRLRALLETCA